MCGVLLFIQALALPFRALIKHIYDALLFLEEADVVGIEEPKKRLIEWIGSMDDGVEVISVVGMGGLGKTTLVKKVYDGESVKKHFDQHVWVVASQMLNISLQTSLRSLLME